MLKAATDVVAELGYPGMSVARVIARAGVSRRTFYELFEDREECFLAAFDEAVARAAVVVVPAYEGAGQPSGGWPARMRSGLQALLCLLDEEPEMRALLVIGALAAGPKALERRAQVLAALIAAVDEGRSEMAHRQKRAGRAASNGKNALPRKAASRVTLAVPAPLTAEGVVGAVLAVIHARALERDPEPLSDLLGQLMGMIVLPYLGSSAAAQEAARPNPMVRRTHSRPASDPLDGLDMRLTYRTLRVLDAIADLPDLSNRQAADAAGVADQGQISKLLSRLESLGLIHNAGAGRVKGAPNAWRLTSRGEDVQHAIRVQTTRGVVARG